MDLIEEGIQIFLNEDISLKDVSTRLNVPYKHLKDALEKLGYVFRPGIKRSSTINIKNATDEYINNLYNSPSITKIAQKYGISTGALSRRLKELNIDVINYQNRTKFNENIFDSIDTEEKAYWLGFLFADGYIGAVPKNSTTKMKYIFELSLKASDVEHLKKFARFIKHENPNTIVRIQDVKCGGVLCKRCRISLVNKHLWNVLNSYGCTPNKSLTLKFPDPSIFKSEELIKHFIRGYWDGDGCLTWANELHTKPCMSILGTSEFLTNLCLHLPQKKAYALENHNKYGNNTYVFNLVGSVAFKVSSFLYSNSTIYLERKYQRFLEYCRLYKELYKELESKIGEDCDVNPEITTEIKKSVVLYSVENEP